MISYISWKIIDLDFGSVTVLTNSGLWYELNINELIYSKLALNEDLQMHVYHQITENSENLFWFIEKDEKQVFSELIKISGVWWKVAMQILSLWISRLLEAVSIEDNKTIEWIKGIWKKMAEKIILELKDKDFWISIPVDSVISKNNQALSSIRETLVNMGYNPNKIDEELSSLPEWMSDAWDIIPHVIKNIS